MQREQALKQLVRDTWNQREHDGETALFQSPTFHRKDITNFYMNDDLFNMVIEFKNNRRWNGSLYDLKMADLWELLAHVEEKHMRASECTCNNCVTACKTMPCWGTYPEIKNLIRNGYTGKLGVYEWRTTLWTGQHGSVYMLQPAVKNHKSGIMEMGECAFLQNNRCEIHGINKPIEGRFSGCGSQSPMGLRLDIAQSWNNLEAQKLVNKFRKNHL